MENGRREQMKRISGKTASTDVERKIQIIGPIGEVGAEATNGDRSASSMSEVKVATEMTKHAMDYCIGKRGRVTTGLE